MPKLLFTRKIGKLQTELDRMDNSGDMIYVDETFMVDSAFDPLVVQCGKPTEAKNEMLEEWQSEPQDSILSCLAADRDDEEEEL